MGCGGSLTRFGDAAGHILNGLVTIPLAEGDVPGLTELDIEASHGYVLLGSTHLLEGFSQAHLVRFLPSIGRLIASRSDLHLLPTETALRT